MEPKSIQQMKCTFEHSYPDTNNAELEAIIARLIQEEIDTDILFGILEDSGWSRITIHRYISKEESATMNAWALEHCSGKYKNYGGHWIFESEQDTAAFVLRWS